MQFISHLNFSFTSLPAQLRITYFSGLWFYPVLILWTLSLYTCNYSLDSTWLPSLFPFILIYPFELLLCTITQPSQPLLSREVFLTFSFFYFLIIPTIPDDTEEFQNIHSMKVYNLEFLLKEIPIQTHFILNFRSFFSQSSSGPFFTYNRYQ